jgi:hypothetical protein
MADSGEEGSGGHLYMGEREKREREKREGRKKFTPVQVFNLSCQTD